MIIMIIIGIQMARCTRVASRESLPRAVAETNKQRPRPRPRPRRSKTVAETETESRDEATSTSASHTQMANKRHSRVYFMLPAEAEAAEQTEARSASGCIRVRRASNMLRVVFEVRAVCSVATVLFIFRQTLCVWGQPLRMRNIAKGYQTSVNSVAVCIAWADWHNACCHCRWADINPSIS